MESELDGLRALVREQGERIRALETRASARPAPDADERPDPTRRQLFRLAGAAAAGGVAATIGAGALGASPASADTGDNLVLGQENQTDDVTSLVRTAGPSSDPLYGTGLVVTARSTSANGYLFGLVGEADYTDDPTVQPLPRNSVGVGGFAREGMGVYATGVFGVSGSGTSIGVLGDGPIGLASAATRADLWLGPGYPRTRDDSKGHDLGQLWRDDAGVLWLCVGPGAAGHTGTWQKVGGPTTAGQLHMVSPSIRVYDSRVGQLPLDVAKGKLTNSAERVIDARHGGAVPASADGGTVSAALVNVTITETTSTGGYLALFENGTTWPGNSSINWDAIGRATANTTVVALDADGQFTVRASPAGGTDFVIDVLGYWL